jgi:spermidine synthase
MNKLTAIIVSAGCGFLSLALEIEWVRYMAFVMHTLPYSFSFTLGAYLFGIAGGAAIGKIISQKSQNIPNAIAIALALSAIVDCALVFALPVIAGAFLPLEWHRVPSLIGFFSIVTFLIVLTSALKAIVFPLVHHVASKASVGQVGQSMSHIYFANVMGATLGPLVVGFWALEAFGLQKALLLEAFCTGLLALYAWLATTKSLRTSLWAPTLAAFSLVIIAFTSVAGDEKVISSAAKGTIPATHQLQTMLENRHGVIYTARKKGETSDLDDMTLAMGAYDGRTNLNLRPNSNGVSRVYLLAALQPKPKRILFVGLSSGAWCRVLMGFPGVEHIDVLEINPGYRDLILGYPHLAVLFKDPRVSFHFDDGRRWLKNNKPAPYDLIVMNTTQHYRAYTSYLLADDFMQLMKANLAKDGILAWNPTGSIDSLYTVSTLFPKVMRYGNMGIAADFDFVPRMSANKDVFYNVDVGASSLKRGEAESEKAVKNLLDLPLISLEEAQKIAGRKGELITIENMLPEYKYGSLSFQKILPSDQR